MMSCLRNYGKNNEDALMCEEFWNLNNGRTLCKNCHKLTDNYLKHYGKNRQE